MKNMLKSVAILLFVVLTACSPAVSPTPTETPAATPTGQIPATAPETGVIEVLDAGQTLVGTSLQEDQTMPLEMTAEPRIAGRDTGATEALEQGVAIIIDYSWQVVTKEYIVGYLTSTFTSKV